MIILLWRRYPRCTWISYDFIVSRDRPVDGLRFLDLQHHFTIHTVRTGTIDSTVRCKFRYPFDDASLSCCSYRRMKPTNSHRSTSEHIELTHFRAWIRRILYITRYYSHDNGRIRICGGSCQNSREFGLVFASWLVQFNPPNTIWLVSLVLGEPRVPKVFVSLLSLGMYIPLWTVNWKSLPSLKDVKIAASPLELWTEREMVYSR